VKDLLQHHSRPKNKEEMIQTMQGVGEQVSLEQLQRLISNFSNRMQVVILAKGGSTTSQTWKAMESNRFPHVFRKKKGSHF
jgi:hypothetical protein